jgi:hypothetical protein
MKLLNNLFKYVALTTSKFNIDESHGMFHAMEILQFASSNYKFEKKKNPELEKHERIIYVSSILHDMCDKKYMDEQQGIASIEDFLKEKIPQHEIEATKRIISTMSYSTVKKNGFPDLKEYQLAYHIVRESDLLCAYDFDRAIIYNMYRRDGDITKGFEDAENIFHSRILKHVDDGLLITDFSKEISAGLHSRSLIRMEMWRDIIKNPVL